MRQLRTRPSISHVPRGGRRLWTGHGRHQGTPPFLCGLPSLPPSFPAYPCRNLLPGSGEAAKSARLCSCCRPARQIFLKSVSQIASPNSYAWKRRRLNTPGMVVLPLEVQKGWAFHSRIFEPGRVLCDCSTGKVEDFPVVQAGKAANTCSGCERENFTFGFSPDPSQVAQKSDPQGPANTKGAPC